MPLTITYGYVCIIWNLRGMFVPNQDGNVTDFTRPSKSDKLPQELKDTLLMNTYNYFHDQYT
jgi:hypothetical protein